jgi:hypothetical protein
MMIKRSAVYKSYEKLLFGNPYRQFWAKIADTILASQAMAPAYGDTRNSPHGLSAILGLPFRLEYPCGLWYIAPLAEIGAS